MRGGAFGLPGLRSVRSCASVLSMTAVIGLLMLAFAGAASASSKFGSSVPNSALLLASTVTPGTATDGSGQSLEQQQAQLDGYNVTVVDDATWSSMTATQFAQYQVIIIGDPTCGSTVGPGNTALNNASVWEPVVMSSGGNKVLIGTDPTFHNTGPTGSQRGDLLEKNGIAFAGAVAGATGAYIDLSCTYDSTTPNTPVPILDGLSTHGPGQFTAVGEGFYSACATGVNIVAASGPTTGLTDADLSNWGCSVHEAFDSFPSDYTPLALAPSSSGFPSTYCANDVSTGTLACGSPYIMVSGGGVSVSSNVTLTPSSQTLTAGGSASLLANVTNGSGPVSGGSVVFSVDTGPNTGKTFTGTTDSSGNVTFTYSDTGGSGTDSVSATYTDSSGVKQKATASVTWSPSTGDPAITASARSGQGSANHGTRFAAVFTDPDTAATASEYSATIDWGDGTTSSGTIFLRPAGMGHFEVHGAHRYASAGTYTVTVTIVDVDNTSNTATATTMLAIGNGTHSVVVPTRPSAGAVHASARHRTRHHARRRAHRRAHRRLI